MSECVGMSIVTFFFVIDAWFYLLGDIVKNYTFISNYTINIIYNIIYCKAKSEVEFFSNTLLSYTSL